MANMLKYIQWDGTKSTKENFRVIQLCQWLAYYQTKPNQLLSSLDEEEFTEFFQQESDTSLNTSYLPYIPPLVMCHFCHTDYLHWEKIPSTSRRGLFKQNNKRHICHY